MRHDDRVPLDPTPRVPLTATAPAPQAVLTVSGVDRPGVTARLFSALADARTALRRSRCSTSSRSSSTGTSSSASWSAPWPTARRRAATRPRCWPTSTRLAAEVAAATGMSGRGRVGRRDRAGRRPAGRPHHVIVLGRPVPPDAVAGAARAIAGIGGNIDAIRRLSDYPVTSFELTVSGAEATALRTALASVAAATGADIAVEQVGLARRSKRLIVLDVDSTLVRGEVIDELAARAGRAAEVARITAAAMNGELDFAESLRARVGVAGRAAGRGARRGARGAWCSRRAPAP